MLNEREIRADCAFGLYDFNDMEILTSGKWRQPEDDCWKLDFTTKCGLTGRTRYFDFVVRFEKNSPEVREAYIAA